MIHGSNAMLGMAAQPTALDIEMNGFGCHRQFSILIIKNGPKALCFQAIFLSLT